MPVSLSYDLDTTSATSDDWARIRLALTRLAWEPVGSSAWRYPRLDRMHEPEDLVNHVFPVGNVLRSVCIDRGISVSSFSIDVHSRSDWRDGDVPMGTPILSADKIPMLEPKVAQSSGAKLSEKTLRRMI